MRCCGGQTRLYGHVTRSESYKQDPTVIFLTSSLPPTPARRADAVRNRARLLDAARAAFAEEGLDASIDEIVGRAGFAKGTFFRHFATKDALVEALLTDRLLALREIAREINASHEPGWDALRATMESLVDHVAADCSFSESLRAERPLIDGPDVQRARRELRDEVERTLVAAQDTGEVRPDVAPSDLPMIMIAIISATAPVHAAHPDLGRRYLRLFLDGLRNEAPSDLGAPALPDQELQIRHGG